MKTENINLTKSIIITIFLSGFITSASMVAQNITPPSCFGGDRMMKEFIKEEMIYPQVALAAKTEGDVELSYIILPNGNVSNLQVSKSVSKEIDAEAIRIFNHILWNPATELGKPIAYLGTFEIRFSIKKYLKWAKLRGYDSIDYPFQPIDTSNKVFAYKEVDKMPFPRFEKGMNFSRFIQKNLVYPEAAFKQNIAGNVKLKFVVEPSGRISNILIEESLGGGCTEEAIRVVKLMSWMPGIIDEMAVRTCMELEIAFDIAGQTVGGKIPTPGQVY
jgi:TonB family protein